MEWGAGGGEQVCLEHLRTLISFYASDRSLVSGSETLEWEVGNLTFAFLECSGKFGLSFPA